MAIQGHPSPVPASTDASAISIIKILTVRGKLNGVTDSKGSELKVLLSLNAMFARYFVVLYASASVHLVLVSTFLSMFNYIPPRRLRCGKGGLLLILKGPFTDVSPLYNSTVLLITVFQ